MEEIKEILQNLKEHTWLEYEEMDKLLDYITNLQEENKRLQQNNYDMQGEMAMCWQKIDKAIEYIEKNKHLSMFADCRELEEDWAYDLEINPRDLLNILQYGSDENVKI